MKEKRHTTEEIIRIVKEAASDKDLEAVWTGHLGVGREGVSGGQGTCN